MSVVRLLALAGGLSAGAACAGGYVAPVIPADIPAEVAQEAAAMCSERPEICTLIAVLLVLGAIDWSGDRDAAPVAPSPSVPPPVDLPDPPVDPSRPPVLPVDPPFCVEDCAPVDPGTGTDPGTVPAPVPLSGADGLMASAFVVLAALRWRRRLAGLFRPDPGCGWVGHDPLMPRGGYPRGSAVLG